MFRNGSWKPRGTVMVRGALSLLALAAAAGGASCSSTAQTSGGAVCTYRQEVPCKGNGGCDGTRICLPDLSGFGACTCGADGGTRDSGARDAARHGDR